MTIEAKKMEAGFLAHVLRSIAGTHGGRSLAAHVRWQAEEIERLRAEIAKRDGGAA